MATPEENHHYWNQVYDWPLGGEEWSRGWGNSSMQWAGTILPRIQDFLPCQRLLELGSGFGRWTEYLLPHCQELIGVDLSEKCIKALRQRFQGQEKARFVACDGASLPGVEDSSVDFIFCFESLVHAEEEELRAYLREFERVLTADGAVFMHHSNRGAYDLYFDWTGLLGKGLRKTFNRWGLLDLDQWRAPSVTAELFRNLVDETQLCCLRQEKINWGARRLIDCFSTVVAGRHEPTEVVENPYFMDEVLEWGQLAALYHPTETL